MTADDDKTSAGVACGRSVE